MKLILFAATIFLVGCTSNEADVTKVSPKATMVATMPMSSDAETTATDDSEAATAYSGEVFEIENPQQDQMLQFYFKLPNPSRVEVQVMSNEQAGSYDLTTSTALRVRLPQGREVQAQYDAGQHRLIAELPSPATPPVSISFAATITNVPETSGSVMLKQLSTN